MEAAGKDSTIEVPFPPELESEGLAIVGRAEGPDLLLLKVGDSYCGVDRECPHEEGDLGEGLMFGRNIKCPVHGYIFDMTTGKCLNSRGYWAQVYDVEVRGASLVLQPRQEPDSR